MPLWGYGFRPFFLGAGVLAMLIIPWWAGAFAWGVPLPTAWPPVLWHGHEMLFGFIGAAIAGFLLTAVPSWTGERGFAGWRLIMLTTLWAVGRLAVETSALWSAAVTAGLDLLFLPGLAALVLPPLVRSGNRNTALVAVLAALWSTDLAFYYGLLHGNAALARQATLIGVDVVLLLITVIGGRIIPAFTSATLKQRGILSPLRPWRAMTPLAIAAMVAMTLTDLLRPESTAAGIIAGIAALLQAARLAQWQGLRTVREPILWVLHIGYLWLPVGLGLKALSLLAGVAFAAYYLHALTIGAASTLIVAVMSRASLGHTGRPLVASRPTACAYGLLTAAAVVRVFGPEFLPLSYPYVIVLAAALWTAAFGLFFASYAPILLRPRADGKPG